MAGTWRNLCGQSPSRRRIRLVNNGDL
jgi:hypothetical protein